jgi:hypothetical protein
MGSVLTNRSRGRGRSRRAQGLWSVIFGASFIRDRPDNTVKVTLTKPSAIPSRTIWRLRAFPETGSLKIGSATPRPAKGQGCHR